MTPAIVALQKAHADFRVHTYEHDPNSTAFAKEAVSKLGLCDTMVYKTLLVTDTRRYFVAIVPACHQLNLSKLAKILKIKKLQMAHSQDAERITGYCVGGISPFGQKRTLPTIISICAKSLPHMYVSGGKRGVQIQVCPEDLARLTQGSFANIT